MCRHHRQAPDPWSFQRIRQSYLMIFLLCPFYCCSVIVYLQTLLIQAKHPLFISGEVSQIGHPLVQDQFLVPEIGSVLTGLFFLSWLNPFSVGPTPSFPMKPFIVIKSRAALSNAPIRAIPCLGSSPIGSPSPFLFLALAGVALLSRILRISLWTLRLQRFSLWWNSLYFDLH